MKKKNKLEGKKNPFGGTEFNGKAPRLSKNKPKENK